MLKSELRQQIRTLKRQFTPQQLEELSLPVIARLRPLLAQAATVFAYYSLPDEVSTHRLVDELVAEGKTVLLPKVTGPGTMAWHRYTSRADLVRGAYGIEEPDSDSGIEEPDPDLVDGLQAPSNSQLSIVRSSFARLLPKGRKNCQLEKSIVNCQFQNAVILVPGLAFDSSGRRLGRGRGYYDRFLAAHPDIYKIGVCFDFQKVPEVPVDAYDVAVDVVV